MLHNKGDKDAQGLVTMTTDMMMNDAYLKNDHSLKQTEHFMT